MVSEPGDKVMVRNVPVNYGMWSSGPLTALTACSVYGKPS